MTFNILERTRKAMGWCPLVENNLKSRYMAHFDLGFSDKVKGDIRGEGEYSVDGENAGYQMEIEDDDIDVVSAGLVIVITGLLIILFAHAISDFSYVPMKTIVVQDKYSQISNIIYVSFIRIIGLLVIVIGSALFFRNFINLSIDNILRRFDR